MRRLYQMLGSLKIAEGHWRRLLIDTLKRLANDPKVIDGTAYTLKNSDWGRTLRFTNAAVVTITVPSELEEGFECTCVKKGAGNLVFTAGAGMTAQGVGTTVTTQYVMVLVQVEENKIYGVYGDLI